MENLTDKEISLIQGLKTDYKNRKKAYFVLLIIIAIELAVIVRLIYLNNYDEIVSKIVIIIFMIFGILFVRLKSRYHILIDNILKISLDVS